MEFEGKVWKDGKFWLAEVPAFDFMTQGLTKKEAIDMVQDGLLELIDDYFESKKGKDFAIHVTPYKDGTLGISGTDNKLMIAFSLRKQREKSGSTVREASQRLGSTSPNAYAQYERGQRNISLDKFESLLTVANPSKALRIRVG